MDATSSHSVRGGRKNLCQCVQRENGKGKSRSATPNTADVVSEMLETVQGQGYRLHLGGFCSRLSLGFLVSLLGIRASMGMSAHAHLC